MFQRYLVGMPLATDRRDAIYRHLRIELAHASPINVTAIVTWLNAILDRNRSSLPAFGPVADVNHIRRVRAYLSR